MREMRSCGTRRLKARGALMGTRVRGPSGRKCQSSVREGLHLNPSCLPVSSNIEHAKKHGMSPMEESGNGVYKSCPHKETSNRPGSSFNKLRHQLSFPESLTCEG